MYVLTLEVPGVVSTNAGVMLVDPTMNAVHLRLRRDWGDIAPEEAEILEALQGDLDSKAAEIGAVRLMAWMGDSLSNVLRVSEPRDVIVEDFERALGRHYRQHVQTHARAYVTHLPRYTLAVAAGKFLENEEVAEEGWEEAPAGLRLSEGMFVARIVGRSMEPRIPDGSLCVFRQFGAGSRQGKLVLVEYLGGGTNDRYTVKRYTSIKTSEKTQHDDGTWSHERIRLEPLNPEFDAWDLDPKEDRYRVLAEFVQVLY